MDISLKAVFEYVESTSWVDNTQYEVVLEKANRYCDDLPPTLTKGKILHRICGQSGCGKTTQLCYAIEQNYLKKGKSPLIIGVRTFAPLHPDYTQLLNEHGPHLIREKTNGFALKCLCAVLEILSKKDILIILDLTLLDPLFEEYIVSLFKKNYQVYYHIFSVNKSISDSFIEKRKSTSKGLEAGRVIFNSSSRYFYDILPIGLKYLVENEPRLKCIIWNVFDKNPTYVGEILESMEIFSKNRELLKPFNYSESELRQAKVLFYEKFLN